MRSDRSLLSLLLAVAVIGVAACNSTAPSDLSGSAVGTDIETAVAPEAAPQEAAADEAPMMPAGFRAAADPKGQARAAAAQQATGSADDAAPADAVESTNSLTPTETGTLLAAHNRWRANFGSAPLRWDPAVAAVAQAWADQMAAADNFEHSGNRSFGENLWAGSVPASAWTKDGIVDDWGNEVQDWDLSCTGGLAECCSPGKACGHFTQVVWSETTKLGCGQASSASMVYVVCNYAPPGNFPRSPFSGGRAPTAVPTGAPAEPTVAVPTATTAPVEPPAAPAQPTTAPVQPTAAPAQPTAAPVQPTSKPSGSLWSWQTSATNLGIAIPDNSSTPGTHRVTVTRLGTIASIGVTVDIKHSYVGDLTVKLYHPDGTSVVLRDQTGGSSQDIDEVYGKGGIPVAGLSALNGKPLAGTWQVRVYDSAAEDEGTLEGVTLDFTYAKP